jgi:predicted nucleic acid-binding protein
MPTTFKARSRGGLNTLFGASAAAAAKSAASSPPRKPPDLLERLHDLAVEVHARPLAQHTPEQLRALADRLGKLQADALTLAAAREEDAWVAAENRAEAVAAAAARDVEERSAEYLRKSKAREWRPDDPVLSMSIAELKQVIADGGLSADDCIERSELQARAREALARTEGGAAAGEYAA